MSPLSFLPDPFSHKTSGVRLSFPCEAWGAARKIKKERGAHHHNRTGKPNHDNLENENIDKSMRDNVG